MSSAPAHERTASDVPRTSQEQAQLFEGSMDQYRAALEQVYGLATEAMARVASLETASYHTEIKIQEMKSELVSAQARLKDILDDEHPPAASVKTAAKAKDHTILKVSWIDGVLVQQ